MFVLFPLVIVWSVLVFAAFDELFGIVKLFLCLVDITGKLHFDFVTSMSSELSSC
jgi:hypothetical protein